ncbi:MAG TPA: cytochrome P450, partial [Acidimicrobiales bacterium]|nr:cytochrome P450 [Acidimicrobiales bacterium]
MSRSVHELDLPVVDIGGIERFEALNALADARHQHWLARQPLGYVVTTHDDAKALLRDRRFHSALSLLPAMAGLSEGELGAPDSFFERRSRSILAMEGPEHARLRRLVAPAFTPAAAEHLRPFMTEVITGLVDSVAPLGRCDLVADVCEPYPIPIICELLGAPKEDWKQFSEWATDIFRIFNQDLVADMPLITRATSELDAYVRAMVERRRTRPADDLLSALIAVEEEGDRLSTDELVMLAEAVLMAGTDTTRNQLACSLSVLVERPDQLARLAEHPDMAQGAVEETMRYLGAVRGTARVASEDIEYRDVLFPQGTLVAVSLAAANRDPGMFGEPDGFDIARAGAGKQMTFGSGIHHCLGASLARAELQEALPVIAARLPGLAAD